MNKFNKFSKGKPGIPQGKKQSQPGNKPKKNQHRPPSAPRPASESSYDETGMEAAYFKSLVDTETPLVVVMRTGEEIRGVVRYYDKEVFSLGPEDGSPKLFLRKDSVRYLYEIE